jgi:hypothetical protein
MQVVFGDDMPERQRNSRRNLTRRADHLLDDHSGAPEGVVSVIASMSAGKSSHRTIFLIASSGSPLLLIASSLRSRSKKPFYPMTRPLHLPIFACGYRVRFA